MIKHNVKNMPIAIRIVLAIFALIMCIYSMPTCEAEEEYYGDISIAPSEVVSLTDEEPNRKEMTAFVLDSIERLNNININLYFNTPSLQKVMETYVIASDELDTIMSWPLPVLKDRYEVFSKEMPKMLVRNDKLRLVKAINTLESNRVVGDKRYKGDQVSEARALKTEAESVLGNMDASMDRIFELEGRIYKFTDKYVIFPWWAWLIFVILAVIGILLGILNIVILCALCIPLARCTFLLWWHVLLIYAPIALIIDMVSWKIMSEI